LLEEYREVVPKLEKMYGDLGKNLEAIIKKEDPQFKRNLPPISSPDSKGG
jgi:translation initiation factor 2 alpha subunit (eIF-2alpha)